MKEFFFSFRSITEAQQARQLLQRQGIAARLERSPRSMQTGGCGFGLRVAGRDYPRARALLRNVRAVYTFGSDGKAGSV